MLLEESSCRVALIRAFVPLSGTRIEVQTAGVPSPNYLGRVEPGGLGVGANGPLLASCELGRPGPAG